jgi:hypothetical protein
VVTYLRQSQIKVEPPETALTRLTEQCAAELLKTTESFLRELGATEQNAKEFTICSYNHIMEPHREIRRNDVPIAWISTDIEDRGKDGFWYTVTATQL